jgi:hypothetical protein
VVRGHPRRLGPLALKVRGMWLWGRGKGGWQYAGPVAPAALERAGQWGAGAGLKCLSAGDIRVHRDLRLGWGRAAGWVEAAALGTQERSREQ